MKVISVKKSYKDGHVSMRIVLKSGGWGALKVEGSADISSADAREFAISLIAEADRADAKIDAKAASDERRKKWRDREIAAGRLKVLDARSFFGR